MEYQNITTDQTQTLLAIGTCYVQGEDVAAKGRIILVSVGKDPQEPNSWVSIVRMELLMSCCRIFSQNEIGIYCSLCCS